MPGAALRLLVHQHNCSCGADKITQLSEKSSIWGRDLIAVIGRSCTEPCSASRRLSVAAGLAEAQGTAPGRAASLVLLGDVSLLSQGNISVSQSRLTEGFLWGSRAAWGLCWQTSSMTCCKSNSFDPPGRPGNCKPHCYGYDGKRCFC